MQIIFGLFSSRTSNILFVVLLPSKFGPFLYSIIPNRKSFFALAGGIQIKNGRNKHLHHAVQFRLAQSIQIMLTVCSVDYSRIRSSLCHLLHSWTTTQIASCDIPTYTKCGTMVYDDTIRNYLAAVCALTHCSPSLTLLVRQP
jgi:hypothetical protein